MPSSKSHSRLGSAASPVLALGPWLTNSGGSGGETTADAVAPVPMRRAPPLPLLSRIPSQQQQQQQLVPIKPPPAPHRAVAIVPVTTAVAPLQGSANNSDRMKELQSVLFPSQRGAPVSAAEGEIAVRSRSNENDAVEADALPRLANLDWLSNNLGQSGRFSQERTSNFVRAPGYYAPGIDSVSLEPTCIEERAKCPNHFFPVVAQGMATRREALALHKWLDVRWQQATNRSESGAAPGEGSLNGSRPGTREAELDQYARHFDLGNLPAGRPTAAYLGRGSTPATIVTGTGIPQGQFFEPTEVPMGDRVGVHRRRSAAPSNARHLTLADVEQSYPAGAEERASVGPRGHMTVAGPVRASIAFRGDVAGDQGRADPSRASMASMRKSQARQSTMAWGKNPMDAEAYISQNPRSTLPPVPPTAQFYDRLKVLSLAVAELARQESVHSAERARLQCRVWNMAVGTYDDELRTMRLRTAIAEELARTSIIQRNASIKSQRVTERENRTVRKAMLGMSLDEEGPARLRAEITALEEELASTKEVLATAMSYMMKGTGSYMWQRTRMALDVGIQGMKQMEAQARERLEHEMQLAGQKGSGVKGAFQLGDIPSSEELDALQDTVIPVPAEGTQHSLRAILRNPALVLEIVHTFEAAAEQAGATRGAASEMRRAKAVAAAASAGGAQAVVGIMQNMTSFHHDPSVAALVASGMDMDQAKGARRTAERLAKLAGAPLQEELSDLLRRNPGNLACALLTTTDRHQRRLLMELRPEQVAKMLGTLYAEQQAPILEMMDALAAGRVLALMDGWEAAQAVERLPELAAANVLIGMDSVTCAAVIKNVRPAAIAMILSRTTVAQAAELLALLDEETASRALCVMPMEFVVPLTTETGANIVANLLRVMSNKARQAFFHDMARLDAHQLQKVFMIFDPANGFRECQKVVDRVRLHEGMPEVDSGNEKEEEEVAEEVAAEAEEEEEEEEEEEDELHEDGGLQGMEGASLEIVAEEEERPPSSGPGSRKSTATGGKRGSAGGKRVSSGKGGKRGGSREATGEGGVVLHGLLGTVPVPEGNEEAPAEEPGGSGVGSAKKGGKRKGGSSAKKDPRSK